MVESDWDPVPEQEDLLHIDRTVVGTTVVLTASGEVDLSSAPHLRAALGDVLDDPETDGTRPESVVLDLTAVTFLGSTGLAVLVDANWQATARRVPLGVVVGERAAVARALQAAGIDEHLTIYPDVASALSGSTADR